MFSIETISTEKTQWDSLASVPKKEKKTKMSFVFCVIPRRPISPAALSENIGTSWAWTLNLKKISSQDSS